ncbi:MAG: PH domain-containing protein [Pseudomonadota bacterium]
MTQFLAANGQPFTDMDAAEYKAGKMSLESGEQFEVVPVEGGFAVQPADTVTSLPVLPGAIAPAGPMSSRSGSKSPPFVRVIRPAWRSQVVSFFVVVIGAFLMAAPTWPIALFSMDAMYQVNESMPGLWQDIQFLGFALVLIGVAVGLFRRYWRKSILTNSSLTQSTGLLLFKNTSVIELRNVHVVQVNKPNLIHMLLNLGTVELSTPGSAADDASIVDVAAPQKLAEFVRRLMQDVHVKPT